MAIVIVNVNTKQIGEKRRRENQRIAPEEVKIIAS